MERICPLCGSTDTGAVPNNCEIMYSENGVRYGFIEAGCACHVCKHQWTMIDDYVEPYYDAEEDWENTWFDDDE
jgi:formate dehydrogenase maturation protein FdhE